tara:strand:+ start:1795 stop:2286 length:492 start_codon:yes stop_codon:yes gene_type:complete
MQVAKTCSSFGCKGLIIFPARLFCSTECRVKATKTKYRKRAKEENEKYLEVRLKQLKRINTPSTVKDKHQEICLYDLKMHTRVIRSFKAGLNKLSIPSIKKLRKTRTQRGSSRWLLVNFYTLSQIEDIIDKTSKDYAETGDFRYKNKAKNWLKLWKGMEKSLS